MTAPVNGTDERLDVLIAEMRALREALAATLAALAPTPDETGKKPKRK